MEYRDAIKPTREFAPIASLTALLLSPVIIALILMLASTMARSAEGQSSGNAPAETIVVSKAFDLLNALNMVTGQHEETVGTGDKQRIVSVPYIFDDGPDPKNLGATFGVLTDDISALRIVVEKAQGEIRRLKQWAEAKADKRLCDTGDARCPADIFFSPEQRALDDKVNAILESQRPIDKLGHVKRAALKIGENHYLGSVIASLKPIIDEK